MMPDPDEDLDDISNQLDPFPGITSKRGQRMRQRMLMRFGPPSNSPALPQPLWKRQLRASVASKAMSAKFKGKPR